MYSQNINFVKDGKRLAELTSGLSRAQLEGILKMHDRIPTAEMLEMHGMMGQDIIPTVVWSPSSTDVVLRATPSSDAAVTASDVSDAVTGAAEWIGGQVDRVSRLLCNPIFQMGLTALASFYPQARPAIAIIVSACGSRDTYASNAPAVRRALRILRDILGRGPSGSHLAPVSNIGGFGALALGADRLLNGDTSSPDDAFARQIITSARAQDVIHAVEADPSLDTLPVMPLGPSGRAARAGYYMLEASTRGGAKFAYTVNAEGSATPDLTSNQVAALAAAVITSGAS